MLVSKNLIFLQVLQKCIKLNQLRERQKKSMNQLLLELEMKMIYLQIKKQTNFFLLHVVNKKPILALLNIQLAFYIIKINIFLFKINSKRQTMVVNTALKRRRGK